MFDNNVNWKPLVQGFICVDHGPSLPVLTSSCKGPLSYRKHTQESIEVGSVGKMTIPTLYKRGEYLEKKPGNQESHAYR
jgi:hypothetical protein